MKFRSDFDVDLLRCMADDASVISAARVSTRGSKARDLSRDESVVPGFIHFLMKNRHGSPFEHNAFTWFISAPIFVFREFQRHRIASYNEQSGRYMELAPVFYVPPPERPLVQVGKPGEYRFEAGSETLRKIVLDELEASAEFGYDSYQALLEEGVAREVARMSLPIHIYSSMYVTMNARALMNFLSLRVRSDDSTYASFPQWEIDQVAQAMEDGFAHKMPVTHGVFVANGRVAP